MREINANPSVRMELGRAGENGVTTVIFDVVKEWQAEVGAGGTLQLLVRMDRQDTYPAMVKLQGDKAVWVVTAAETARSGDGQAQLSYLLEGKITKSACYSYTVLPSLEETSGAKPPEPLKHWCMHIEAEATAARTAAEEARIAADEAISSSVTLEQLNRLESNIPTSAAQLTIVSQMAGQTLDMQTWGNAAEAQVAQVAQAAQMAVKSAEQADHHAASALTAVDSKASIDSPAFTGQPTAPTPKLGSNDTSIATTEFVNKAAGGSGVPVYVQDEAKRCASVVAQHQNADTFTLLMISDIHARFGLKAGSINSKQMLESATHAAQAANLVRHQVHIDYAANLGDILWDGPKKHNADETAEQALEMYRTVHQLFAPAFSALPQCWCNGNHDQLGEGGSTSGRLSPQQVYPMIGAWCTGTLTDTNRAAGYGYQDFPEAKIRIIYMNTSESNIIAVGRDQLTWLEKIINIEDKPGWQTIIMSHIPLDMWGPDSSVMRVIKSAKNVMLNLHGHTHNYLVGVLTGTNIPRVAIPNVDFYRTNEYGKNGRPETSDGQEYGTTKTWEKVAGTKDDTAFCVVTIDRKANKLYADHYGAGEDRVVDLPAWEDPTATTPAYRNLVPAAEALESTAPYNGVGYADGKYLTWGGDWTGADTAMVVTGYIPYNPKTDVLYIKGATWDETASHCRVYGFNVKDTAVGSTLSAPSPNADVGVMAKLGDNYYKFTAGKAWKATEMKYIRLSFKGKGAGLIITNNQPID